MSSNQTATAKKFKRYASVVLDRNIAKPLTHGVPDQVLSDVRKGMLVEFPLRAGVSKGIIANLADKEEYPRILPIKRIIDQEFYLTPDLFDLAFWISRYYTVPPSTVFCTVLPSTVRSEVKAKEQLFVSRKKSVEELRQTSIDIRSKYPVRANVLEHLLNVKRGIYLSELLEEVGCTRSPIDTLVRKGFLSLEKVHVDRSPLQNAQYIRSPKKMLNDEQKIAFDRICESLHASKYLTHLLYGVTGSGKTEVYLQAIEEALKQGKSSIVLVPEIALTTQTIERFRSRFDEKIAILHSRLSNGEKRDQWHKIQQGKAKIIIGARSAIFSPAKNLGLIIIDEEQEKSFKQCDTPPCYHARDVAVMRGMFANATVVLGSATPSLESYHNAEKGKYQLSTLNKRAQEAKKPKVTVIDMKVEYEKAKGYILFSGALLDGIISRFKKGEQTLLFLNKRGYHSALTCQSCGEGVRCPNCDLTLTYHKRKNALLCHLCSYVIAPPPRKCQKCHAVDTLKFHGTGTELVENSLHAIFPEIRTLRIDADTTKHKGSHERLFREFKSGKADILIGTQMIAKGLHFPQVTLVGVLNCDGALNLPDFRASEFSFQLLTQVAGRSGRGEFPGEVILQTLVPTNSTIGHSMNQDFGPFYDEEIEIRRCFDYPPFSRLINIIFSGKDENGVVAQAKQLQMIFSKKFSGIAEVLPVVPCGYPKIKLNYRYQFLIKSKTPLSLRVNLYQELKNHMKVKGIRAKIDIDPVSTF